MIYDLRLAISGSRTDGARGQFRKDCPQPRVATVVPAAAQPQWSRVLSLSVSFPELHKPAAVKILFRSLTQGGFEPESLGILASGRTQSSIVNRKS